MIELSEKAGLPLKLEDNKLIFGEGVKEVMPAARLIEKMGPVLYDKSVKEPEEIYFMYRDVLMEKDLELFSKNLYRYDITVIPAIMLGKEFNKTFGHFHDKVKGEELSYTEIYEVLYGKAHCILQSDDEFYVCEAVAGEKIVIPPNFGHITINPANETLVMANVVSSELLSDYTKFSEMKGAAYLETIDGFVRNENYDNYPEIKRIKPKLFERLGAGEKPLYISVVENPEKFEWLRLPQKYLKEFEEWLK